jgi:hypothetical protein
MLNAPEGQTQFRKTARAQRAADHPLRAEMLLVLADARKRIDRINAPPG